MTTPPSPKDAADSATPEKSPTTRSRGGGARRRLGRGGGRPFRGADRRGWGRASAVVGSRGAPDHSASGWPAPAWAWVVLGLMALLLAIGVTTLAVARNADPSTPEAVEDAKTLVAELEKLNRSLATTNELMSNAIANAEQLSAKAQAKLANLSSQLADVDGGVGQVRSLLGDQLDKPTRSELGSGQDRLQSLKGTLAERSGRLTEQELGRVSRDVAAVGNEVGVATRTGSSRASTMEGRIDALESRQAETDGFRARSRSSGPRPTSSGESLQARRERARTLAAQVLELRRAQALLQRRLDSLGPRR